MTDPVPPHGYTARPATIDDAPAVAALINLRMQSDGDEPDTTPEEVRRDWQGGDLDQESVLVHDAAGEIAAFADLIPNRYLQTSVYGFVHPRHQGHGLGAFLVHWGESYVRRHMAQTPPEARIIVRHYIRETNQKGQRLLQSLGYEPVRVHYWMHITLDGAPPKPQVPEGIIVRTYVPGQDEHALYQAGEESFQDIWNRQPSTLERWIAPTSDPDFDPTLWFLAQEQATPAVAAVCLCSVVGNEGIVNTLGVRHPWRRRGLGLALLNHAFGEFYRRGINEIELSVDAESPTGASRLYTRAGMTVARSYVQYLKEIRPGILLPFGS